MSYKDILGINARNLLYIRKYNKKANIQLVDNKVATKEMLQKNDIPAPKMYAHIESVHDLEGFDFNTLPQNFVVKPNKGYGGAGILVLKSKDKKEIFLKKKVEERAWIDSSKKEYPFNVLRNHIIDAIDGKFSISNAPDSVLIEKKVVAGKGILKLCGEGVPDIRIVVFNSVPVMAMLRLPTQKSSGRANLFAGAVGVGVDIASGVTTHASVKKPKRESLKKHPDTGKDLVGYEVENWDTILKIAVESQIASGLGFIGVDIVIDRKQGPLVLELNARPGLEIQLVNLIGLRKRLNRVKGLKVNSISKGVRIAKELFGGDVEERIKQVSGKPVIGLIEKVELLSKSGKSKIEIAAKIDTGARTSSIDFALAKKMGHKKLISEIRQLDLGVDLEDEEELVKIAKKSEKALKSKYEDLIEFNVVKSSSGITVRPVIRVVYYIAGQKIRSKANLADRSKMSYQMLVGKDDMKNFLVDPSNKSKW